MVDRVSPVGFEDDESVTPSQEASDDDFFAPALPSGEGEIMGSDVIILPGGISKGDAIAYLSRDIPHTNYGLPDFFIRSDLLPQLATHDPISTVDIDAASEGLFYAEGYPTTEDGRNFWSQLPHEPIDAFNLFHKYVQQAEEEGIRQLELLAFREDLDLEKVRQFFLEFYWTARARAYDLFIMAAETRKRQFRTRRMEDSHFTKAEALFNRLMEEKFNNEKWWDELNAKEAVEALIELAKLQRLSVGLTGMNASSLPKDSLPEGASPQQILEHLTKGTAGGNRDAEGFAARLGEFLADEESGMAVQEAIIRISRPQNHATATGFEDE